MTDALPTRWVKVTHHTAAHVAERYLYAAYGSNLKLEQMASRCPEVELIGRGKLANAKITFALHMNIEQQEGNTIPVGLYKLSARDVENLDRKEGLGRSYHRYLVTVDGPQGPVRCFTYCKLDPTLHAPQEAYLQRCLDGYREWKFPVTPVKAAAQAAQAATEARRDHVGASVRNGHNRTRPTRHNIPTGARLADDGSGYWMESLVTGRMKFYPFDDQEPVADGRVRIDERMSLSAFRDAVLANRKPAATTITGYDEGAMFENAKGQQFIRVRDINGDLYWKRVQ